MHSARNQHALITQSSCTQHALSMHSSCSHHATPMHQHAAYQGLVGQKVERLTAAQCPGRRVSKWTNPHIDATAPT